MKTIRKSLTAALMMAISFNATQPLEAGCHGKSRSHSSGHVSSYPSRSYPSHSYPSQSYPSKLISIKLHTIKLIPKQLSFQPAGRGLFITRFTPALSTSKPVRQ